MSSVVGSWIAALLAICSAVCLELPAADESAKAKFPTEQQCREFASKIEATINAQDPSFLDQRLEVDGILKQVSSGIDMDEQFKSGFHLGAKKSLQLGSELCQAIQQGGKYKFLRFRKVDERLVALFRLTGSEGSVNYHECYLKLTPKEDVQIADIYVYTLGEKLSKRARRLFLQGVASLKNGRLQGEFGENIGKLSQMAVLMREKQGAEALKIWNQLPASVQQDKSFLIIRLFAAQQVGDEEYAKAIVDFQKWFPKDPSLDLMLIDGYVLKKRYAEAIQCVESLDQAVGGDPYLQVVIGNIHVIQNQLDQARVFMQKAIAAEPDLADAYWMLVDISMREKKFGETARLLTLIETKLSLQIADLGEVAEFADFVKSKEYQDWNRARAKK